MTPNATCSMDKIVAAPSVSDPSAIVGLAPDFALDGELFMPSVAVYLFMKMSNSLLTGGGHLHEAN